MKRYQVVIERCAIYEIEAEDEKDAEDIAWGMYEECDLNDPFLAEVLEVEQIFLVVPNPSSEGFFISAENADLMIVFYRVRRGHDDEDFFDLVEAFTGHPVLDDSFLLRTGRRHDAR